MGAMAENATTPDRDSRVHPMLVLIVVAIVFPAVLLMRGDGGPWSSRAAALILTLIGSGWAPLLYLTAGAGYGRMIRRWVPGVRGRWCVEIGFGLTLLLSLTHLVGMLGLLTSTSAWVITLIGAVLFIPQLKAHRFSIDGLLSPIHVVITCGIVLALVMACNPPGVLWASEYGGFDALSYHLQLPREWIEQGRIWPSEHNVYSFLPGYLEAGYAHIALMMGGEMLGSDGRALISAQLLSAMMLILSAGCIGELARAATRSLLPESDDLIAGRIAGALTLGTPWLIVVGTLAYNEIAVVLLGASALCVAMRTGIDSWKRAVVCGFIVGGACSCKPTALFLLAPSVGIVLLACTARKRWIVAVLGCVVIGGITITPWLIRNELATGNPVFPQLTGMFGDGHWSDAQHAIYASAHAFDGSILDRFAMLAIPDPSGLDHVSRFRGLTNGQWALTPLLGLIGVVVLLARRNTHVSGVVVLGALGLPLIAWALLTHLQSRFLIPLAPMLIVLGSLLIVRIRNTPARDAVARVVCIGAVMWSVGHALIQRQGNPFVLLDLGPEFAMGSDELDPLPWTGALNLIAGEDETVYLLGDATPIYVTGAVRYNTVYDDWLIAGVMATSPGDPDAWTRNLREQGIDLVVVGFTEFERYARSGWIPESIDADRLIVWINSLGEPIEVWNDPSTSVPIRAIFRINPSAKTP